MDLAAKELLYFPNSLYMKWKKIPYRLIYILLISAITPKQSFTLSSGQSLFPSMYLFIVMKVKDGIN